MGDRDSRSDWSDDRIAENFEPLRQLPSVMARQDVRIEKLEASEEALERRQEKFEGEMRDRFRRLHLRIDQLADRLNDRDREYRRNVILVLGPIALVALLIGAKVLLGIDIGPKLP